MDDLIKRLEAATGPSRELDAMIKAAREGGISHKEGYVEWPGGPSQNSLPYTSSIDAALTLVPDDWTAWQLRSRRCKTAFVGSLTRMSATESAYEEELTGHSAIPAIALCIAALKARL